MIKPIELEPTAELAAASQAQADAADPLHSAWVAANAGSGKTKVLIDRVARLLLRGAEPDHILCVTYTKAAANEMLSRLFQRLGSWSVMDTTDLKSALAKLEGRPDHNYTEDELRRARMLFANALETPGGLRIETIHAFCSRILRRFPLEAGVAPGFREIEDSDAKLLWEQAVSTVIGRIDDSPDLALALDALASAGGATGARRALATIKAERNALGDFSALHGHDLSEMTATLTDYLNPPDETETEIIARIKSEAPLGQLNDLVPALQATGKKSDSKLAAKLQECLAAEDATAFWAGYRLVFFTQSGALGKRNGFTQGADSNSGGQLTDLLALKPPIGTEAARIAEIDEALKRRRAFDLTLALYRISQPVLAAYQSLKDDRAVLDFDDLIERSAELLSSPGKAEWVLYKLDGKLSHVLLDEAQDTSPRQWALLRALTAEFHAGAGAERSDAPRTQFVVGDEKQSIYSFQGADPDHFGVERREFIDLTGATGQPARQPQMAMSFRSTPQILGFVDECWNRRPILVGDPSRAEPPPEADEPVQHLAHRKLLTGCVELVELQPRADVEEPDPWTAPVDQLSSASPKLRLARWIAQTCREMIDDGHGVWHQKDGVFIQRPTEAGDILILVQNRSGGLFDAIIGELKAADLPVAGADRLKPTDHIGVQDCLNLIRFALFPADDLVVAELLKSPFLNLIDDEAHLRPLLEQRNDGETLWSILQGTENELYRDAKALLEACWDARHATPYRFLTEALQFQFSDGTRARDRLVTRLDSPVLDPLEELLSAGLAHDAQDPPSLQTFLQSQDSSDADIKRDLARPDGEIRVMTIHGAKGLEAPIVILADTTRPAANKSNSLLLKGATAPPILASRKEDLAEPEMTRLAAEAERRSVAEHFRLLYVALTRAQDRLIICGSHHGLGKDGFGKHAWYDICAQSMEALKSTEDTGADCLSIRLFGDRPPKLGLARTAKSEQQSLPDWFESSPRFTDGTKEYLSPSSFTDAQYPVSSPFAEGAKNRFLRGKLIHALLEFLPDLPANERQGATDRFLDGVRDISNTQRSEIAATTLGVIHNPEFASVFGPGSRAEVTITGRLKDGPRVEGRVDRLLVESDRVLIVDYKTDRPPPASSDAVDPAYLVQMGAYRDVMRQTFPGYRVDCALLWTDGPRYMQLSNTQMDEALTDARARLQARPTLPT